MGDSWKAYRAYANEVERGNVEPTLVEGHLPTGAKRMTEIGWHGHETAVEATFCEEQGRVWVLPDGRVAETGKSWRPLYYVWDNDKDRRGYRRALPTHLYLYG